MTTFSSGYARQLRHWNPMVSEQALSDAKLQRQMEREDAEEAAWLASLNGGDDGGGSEDEEEGAE